MIPTGEIRTVKDSPFDFTAIGELGKEIEADVEQLNLAGGYDHNWVLNREGKDLELAARVIETNSGRQMEVWTTEPGIQFYSGNGINPNEAGKGDKNHLQRGALCLETQHYPDSPVSYTHLTLPTIYSV